MRHLLLAIWIHAVDPTAMFPRSGNMLCLRSFNKAWRSLEDPARVFPYVSLYHRPQTGRDFKGAFHFGGVKHAFAIRRILSHFFCPSEPYSRGLCVLSSIMLYYIVQLFPLCFKHLQTSSSHDKDWHNQCLCRMASLSKQPVRSMALDLTWRPFGTLVEPASV